MRAFLKSGLLPVAAVVLFFALAAAGNAQTTFALPVTQNQANYRQFDFLLWTASGWKYHSGSDLYCGDLKVIASNCGVVVAMVPAGQGDHGMGDTVILQHQLRNGARMNSS